MLCISLEHTVIISVVTDLLFFIRSIPHLSNRVWSQPTVGKLTAKKKEVKKMRKRAEWQTGLNWPVCCAGDSFPVRRRSSGTNSSLSYIRWLHKRCDSNFTLLHSLFLVCFVKLLSETYSLLLYIRVSQRFCIGTFLVIKSKISPLYLSACSKTWSREETSWKLQEKRSAMPQAAGVHRFIMLITV